jgi:hypothetical protein
LFLCWSDLVCLNANDRLHRAKDIIVGAYTCRLTLDTSDYVEPDASLVAGTEWRMCPLIRERSPEPDPVGGGETDPVSDEDAELPDAAEPGALALVGLGGAAVGATEPTGG